MDAIQLQSKTKQQRWDGKNFNMPRNTLKRRILNKNIDAVETKKILGHYRTVFNENKKKNY